MWNLVSLCETGKKAQPVTAGQHLSTSQYRKNQSRNQEQITQGA
jgi:hypothetical protein